MQFHDKSAIFQPTFREISGNKAGEKETETKKEENKTDAG